MPPHDRSIQRAQPYRMVACDVAAAGDHRVQMSIRTWRFRRVLGIAFLWVLLLLVTSIGRAVVRARDGAPPSTDELYVVIRLLGGPWLFFGPPALILVAWLVARRLHRSGATQ